MGKQMTVLVFGTFDGLHDGHLFLLRKAKRLGDRLIVSVAQDATVERFKKHPPKHTMTERIAALRTQGLADEAVAGDIELGNWSSVKEYRPDIVALGYDQSALEEHLREFIKKKGLLSTLTILPAHDPDRLHSRLLRKK